MLIDTHCHLDAPAFDPDRDIVLERAAENGLRAIVVPAVAPENFAAVRALAAANPAVTYALGVHPLFTDSLSEDWVARLRGELLECRDDPQLVAIGEIGLDFYVKGFDAPRQESIYVEQLKLAAEFDLPVLLHVRRSQDRLLRYLRRIPAPGGIAHAFNGSLQQANGFIELGFALGFGGTMSFEGSRRIRRLVKELPDTAHVLETDAPDLPPQWLRAGRNEPGELAPLASVFAQLRGVTPGQAIDRTGANARRVLPALDRWLSR